jgi:hypothetical protein
MNTPDVNLWRSAEHALYYLERADALPHRTEGEAELLKACHRHFRVCSISAAATDAS